MTEKEIIDYVKNHPSGKVKIALTDIDGILRGKYISVDKFLSAYNSNIGFCEVVFGWDSFPWVRYTWVRGWGLSRESIPRRTGDGKFDGETFLVGLWMFFLGGRGRGRGNSRSRTAESFSQDDTNFRTVLFMLYIIC